MPKLKQKYVGDKNERRLWIPAPTTAPRAICEDLSLKQVREQEIVIPGGTLILPVFKGVMSVNGLTKKLEIVGVDLHPKLDIDCLVGRNLFVEKNILK
ncbi:MAG: hypothetical protein C4B55_06920 [Candidatus Methanophagaceae archaeon]|nr:MAG: hypothetical protein C4B55_06920 [Methanophagales archaeon]